MSEFKREWEQECRNEGGRWAENNLKEFARKRAVLFDLAGFSSTSRISVLIVVLFFILAYLLTPIFLFKGAMDYFIILLQLIVLFFVCNYVWNRLHNEQGQSTDRDSRTGGVGK